MKNNLLDLLKKSHKTALEISEECGISRSTLYAIASCKQIPRLDTALKISKAMGESIKTIFPDVEMEEQNEV